MPILNMEGITSKTLRIEIIFAKINCIEMDDMELYGKINLEAVASRRTLNKEISSKVKTGCRFQAKTTSIPRLENWDKSQNSMALKDKEKIHL